MPFKDPIVKKEFGKKYYKKNRKILRAKQKKYYAKNSHRFTERKRLWGINRRKNDPSYKLKINLRRRVLHALKGVKKNKSTLKLLGVKDIEFVWNHLEKSFKLGMTRQNHGKWHIDHIIPCVSFDLTKPEEQAKCFHYTNLQPLWASENLAKGSKISS